MTQRKEIIRFFAFAACLIILVNFLNETLTAKYMFDDREPMTETYKGFYNMKRDTVDVVVLGTSHAASSFNPQVFYNTKQVRTYNLSSSAQPVAASYYWLKESLRYQHPSVAIFDCNYLFSDAKSEVHFRKAFDNMRWGSVKHEATSAVVQLVSSGNKFSYVLPFFRYHGRWKNLNEWDFSWMKGTEKPPVMKGFWFYLGIASYDGFVPLLDNPENTEMAEFAEGAMVYFDKMVTLCREKGIQLVIVKTPIHVFTQEKHNAMRAWCEENRIPFIDYNEKNVYEDIGFNFDSGDMQNVGRTYAHPNVSGARKISTHMAEYLTEHGYVSGKKDEQWEKTKGFGEGLDRDFELCNTKDIYRYLKLINDKRYTVLISVRDEASNSMDDDIRQSLKALGLKSEWGSEFFQTGYLAVIEKGKVILEDMGNGRAEYFGALRGGIVRLEMISAGYNSGNKSSICVDGEEYSPNGRGLNIVVYSNDRHRVIDAVSFDTYSTELTCTR